MDDTVVEILWDWPSCLMGKYRVFAAHTIRLITKSAHTVDVKGLVSLEGHGTLYVSSH